MGGKHVGLMYGCKSLKIVSNANFCFEMQMGLKLYERTIYGLLCGRIEALTPVCKTYADYLWTYASCYIEQKNPFDSRVCHRKKNISFLDCSIFRSTHGVEVQKPLHRLEMTTIFDEILAACPTHIRAEAVLPFTLQSNREISDSH